jgi:hypothetical protein
MKKKGFVERSGSGGKWAEHFQDFPVDPAAAITR